MVEKYIPKYPLVWQKDNFFIKIFCSIPNIATGILLTANNKKFIIDPGDGILRDLNQEIDSKEILGITDMFISHGHHDHVGGVWSLLTYLSVMRKSSPLNIYYPKGCVEIESIHKAFMQVYSRELSYKITLNQIDNEDSLEKDSVTIQPFEVNHKEAVDGDEEPEAVPSLGFKFFFRGKSICYGGDTAYCENLVTMAKDSDLAIIEAGADSDELSDLHMTQSEAIKIGKTAKEYFLVHVPE